MSSFRVSLPAPRPERGSVALALVLSVAVVVAATVVAIAGVADRSADVGHAAHAADATALAAVLGGPRAAREVAAANGAELVALSADGGIVKVTVEVDGVAAIASAEAVAGSR